MIVSGAATTGAAQTAWRVDATYTRLKPAGGDSRNALSLAALALQDIGPVTPLLTGAATVAGDSVAAAQIGIGVSVLPPWTNRAPFEVGAVVSLYGLAAGDRGQARNVYAQQQLINERSGYWIGGAIGQIDRAESFASNAVEVGAWIAAGRKRYTVIVSSTATEDREIFRNTSMVASELAPRLRVADVAVQLAHQGERFQFEALAGVRMALEGLDGHRTFALGSAGWRVYRGASVLVGGGYRLADPLRGTPEWRYGSVGVRFARTRPLPDESTGRSGPFTTAERAGEGLLRVTIAAPTGARTVEIAGTMTGWDSVALTRTPGGWVVEVPAPSGAHRIVVRVNGGEWRVPQNLTPISDEFGTRSGILIIPR